MVLVIDDSLDPIDQHRHTKFEETKEPKRMGVVTFPFIRKSALKDVALKRPLSTSNISV